MAELETPETSPETRDEAPPETAVPGDEKGLLRDRCGRLKDYWYAACLSDELGEKAPLGRVVLGEKLVLYRDGHGQPLAFRDRCLHRNAELSDGGVLLGGGCIACPYHGWTFDSTGACVRIPSEGADGFKAPKKKLTKFPTREQDGLVWVYMGDPDDIRNEPFTMPHFNERGWGSYYMQTMFDNDVTNCAENFMDVPHTVFVHKGWFRSVASKKVHATVERTRDSVLVTYEQPNDVIGFSRFVLNPDNEPMHHTDKFYMPNVTRVDYDFGSKRSFIITSQITPESDMRSRVYTLISFRLGNRLFNKVGEWLLPPYTRQVIWQDVVIMANQGRALSRYGAQFMHSPADVLHRYIESLRAWSQKGEVGPRPEPRTTEIDFWV
jgi:phenylpropionate dioxygenase-like ring-hydroxylating dioxygenase large terminal subunit